MTKDNDLTDPAKSKQRPFGFICAQQNKALRWEASRPTLDLKQFTEDRMHLCSLKHSRKNRPAECPSMPIESKWKPCISIGWTPARTTLEQGEVKIRPISHNETQSACIFHTLTYLHRRRCHTDDSWSGIFWCLCMTNWCHSWTLLCLRDTKDHNVMSIVSSEMKPEPSFYTPPPHPLVCFFFFPREGDAAANCIFPEGQYLHVLCLQWLRLKWMWWDASHWLNYTRSMRAWPITNDLL